MKTTRPLSMRVYSGVSSLLYPAVSPFLARRGKRGKEDAARLGERKGVASLPRPDGVLVWLHGASVGEVVSLLPVAEFLTGQGHAVLFTSGTVTSAAVAARRLPPGAFHQFVPLDLPVYVARFMDHWQPDIGIFAESELWPNLIHAAHASGAHLVIVNARMSARSHGRWQRMPAFINSVLARFELVLAQTGADGERLASLGAQRVQVVGNLKYDVAPLPADPAKLASLQAALGARPVLNAASTHPGEEEQVIAAHVAAARSVDGLITVIAPRHPARGAEVAALADRAGLAVCRRSEGTLPDERTQIYVADTIGELGLFYRCGKLAFLGGSLVPHGGQNPIEAARLGAAVLHGPHVHNFTEVFAALTEVGGAALCMDAEALAARVVHLLQNPDTLAIMARQASAKVDEMSGAIRRTTDALSPLLEQVQGARTG